MIRNGSTTTNDPDPLLVMPDPATLVLTRELRDHRRRLADTVAHLDPRTVPEGVADGLHDAMAAITDALHVQEHANFGWNG